MKLNARCRYGLRALIDIALHRAACPVTARDISRRQGISQRYLASILVSLKKSGLIEPLRGPSGGYVLARSPDRISLFEVIEGLQGLSPLIPCTVADHYCRESNFCAAREIWQRVEDAIKNSLSAVSLRDITDRQNQISLARLGF